MRPGSKKLENSLAKGMGKLRQIVKWQVIYSQIMNPKVLSSLTKDTKEQMVYTF